LGKIYSSIWRYFKISGRPPASLNRGNATRVRQMDYHPNASRAAKKSTGGVEFALTINRYPCNLAQFIQRRRDSKGHLQGEP